MIIYINIYFLTTKHQAVKDTAFVKKKKERKKALLLPQWARSTERTLSGDVNHVCGMKATFPARVSKLMQGALISWKTFWSGRGWRLETEKK